MSRDDDNGPTSDEASRLIGQLSDVLVEDGELLPTTEEEVARADVDEDIELPPQLASLSFEHDDEDALGLELRLLADFAVQAWLHEFEIPVAEDIPCKFVDGARSLVETERLDLARDSRGAFIGFVNDPLIDGGRRLRRVECRIRLAFIHFAETRGVPQLR